MSGGELFEPFDQLLFRKVRIGPVLAVFQDDDRVRNVRRHGVHRRLRRSRPGEDGLHLGLGLDDAFEGHLHRQRLFQRGGRHAQRLHGDIAFIQGRDELPPQRTEGDAANDEGAERGRQDDFGPVDGGADRRFDPAPRVSEDEGLVLVGVAVLIDLDLLRIPDQQGRHRRHEGEGEDEGADEGQHHRCAHGDEGLALHALKHQQRREDQEDDQLAKSSRFDHLTRRGSSNLEPLPTCQHSTGFGPPLAEHQQGILDHHDRAVDQKAEVQRAQAHEVSADAKAVHADDREQEADRDHQGGDRSRTDVAEQQEQHHDYQQSAFDQVLGDG